MRHDVGLSVKRGEILEFSYIKRDESFFFLLLLLLLLGE